MSARVAVVGDVGGHRRELEGELVRLGGDPRTGELPADLTVVQVGDLVHRGPDSEGVVALVDRYLRHPARRWVQLVGNHEAQYVRDPAFSWPERIAPEAAARIAAWWDEGLMVPAVALDTPAGPWLVTHAGLTSGYWDDALGRPPTAALAAAALVGFVGTHDDVLFHAGQVLGGGAPDRTAGPVWASAAGELVPSWLPDRREGRLAPPLPFHQLHGHATLTDWRRGRLVCGDDVAARTTIDVARAHETTRVGGHQIVGVDPKHGRRPHRPWQAYVLDDARVVGTDADLGRTVP